jgi:hypothetical protein
MSWNTICIEGFCFYDEDENGKYPCGNKSPSHLCLKNHVCPHFAWSKTNELEVSVFIPIRFIFWKRIQSWAHECYWKLRWIFWDQLWFNRRKTEEFFKSIPVITSEECPELLEIEREEKDAQDEFVKWFEKAKLED